MLKIAIIGGGAAGFFAAITAKKTNPNAEVNIFEKGTKVLAKVEITGGGRCNLTNSFAEVTDLKQAYPRGHKLLKRLFNEFDYKDTFQWFENNGVPLVTQEDMCVFPKSQSSMSVINCLKQQAQELGIHTYTSHKLVELQVQKDQTIRVVFEGCQSMLFDRVAITTGGNPQIHTFDYLKKLGHNIEDPIPSLFTFNVSEKALKELMGTVIDPVSVSIPTTKLKATGPLLITHWGLSGPSILKLSSHGARWIKEKGYQFNIAINWISETNFDTIKCRLQEIIINNGMKQLNSIRPYNLPTRLWGYLLNRINISPHKKWNELSRKELNKLNELLTNDIHSIRGKGSFKEEFVTCGGVSLNSIKQSTLESKLCKNLYFAGEVLDIDAITGGFNLQAAWTTGYIVGKNIARIS